MNRVANLSAADVSLRTTVRRKARTDAGLPLNLNLTDGIIAMVMLAAALICYSYYHQMQGKLTAARAERDRVAAEFNAVQIENERIAAEIQALRTNPEAIERAAREELGMIRPGELVLAVDSRPSSR